MTIAQLKRFARWYWRRRGLLTDYQMALLLTVVSVVLGLYALATSSKNAYLWILVLFLFSAFNVWRAEKARRRRRAA
jgi:nicotinamide riboside transporter PnuC